MLKSEVSVKNSSLKQNRFHTTSWCYRAGQRSLNSEVPPLLPLKHSLLGHSEKLLCSLSTALLLLSDLPIPMKAQQGSHEHLQLYRHPWQPRIHSWLLEPAPGSMPSRCRAMGCIGRTTPQSRCVLFLHPFGITLPSLPTRLWQTSCIFWIYMTGVNAIDRN